MNETPETPIVEAVPAETPAAQPSLLLMNQIGLLTNIYSQLAHWVQYNPYPEFCDNTKHGITTSTRGSIWRLGIAAGIFKAEAREMFDALPEHHEQFDRDGKTWHECMYDEFRELANNRAEALTLFQNVDARPMVNRMAAAILILEVSESREDALRLASLYGRFVDQLQPAMKPMPVSRIEPKTCLGLPLLHEPFDSIWGKCSDAERQIKLDLLKAMLAYRQTGCSSQWIRFSSDGEGLERIQKHYLYGMAVVMLSFCEPKYRDSFESLKDTITRLYEELRNNAEDVVWYTPGALYQLTSYGTMLSELITTMGNIMSCVVCCLPGSPHVIGEELDQRMQDAVEVLSAFVPKLDPTKQVCRELPEYQSLLEKIRTMSRVISTCPLSHGSRTIQNFLTEHVFDRKIWHHDPSTHDALCDSMRHYNNSLPRLNPDGCQGFTDEQRTLVQTGFTEADFALVDKLFDPTEILDLLSAMFPLSREQTQDTDRVSNWKPITPPMEAPPVACGCCEGAPQE